MHLFILKLLIYISYSYLIRAKDVFICLQWHAQIDFFLSWLSRYHITAYLMHKWKNYWECTNWAFYFDNQGITCYLNWCVYIRATWTLSRNEVTVYRNICSTHLKWGRRVFVDSRTFKCEGERNDHMLHYEQVFSNASERRESKCCVVLMKIRSIVRGEQVITLQMAQQLKTKKH